MLEDSISQVTDDFEILTEGSDLNSITSLVRSLEFNIIDIKDLDDCYYYYLKNDAKNNLNLVMNRDKIYKLGFIIDSCNLIYMKLK